MIVLLSLHVFAACAFSLDSAMGPVAWSFGIFTSNAVLARSLRCVTSEEHEETFGDTHPQT